MIQQRPSLGALTNGGSAPLSSIITRPVVWSVGRASNSSPHYFLSAVPFSVRALPPRTSRFAAAAAAAGGRHMRVGSFRCSSAAAADSARKRERERKEILR